MKKLLLVALVAVFIGGTATFASANLILNSSFESVSVGSFDNWRESGAWALSYNSRTGANSLLLFDGYSNPDGTLGPGEAMSNKFDITPGTYEYGAYFKFRSYNDADPTDWPSWPADRPGATLSFLIGTPDKGDAATIVDIGPGLQTSWTQLADGIWESDWYLIRGTVDISQGGQGELNIFIQNYSDVGSWVMVDDAFVKPVPEPATMLLLGSGLVGLAGLRKRFKK